MDTVGAAAPSVRRVLPAVVWFDWLVLAVCSWLVGGGYLDAWAHRHVLTLDTFFTPWHGVLYTGYAACVTVLGGRWLRTHSLPGGCQLSLLGCGIFAVGGLSDLLWHTIFGIERNIATLSASHLLLIVAMGLIVTGPLRASRAVRGRRAPATAVVRAALVFSYLGLVTQFAQPYLDRLAAGPSVLNDMPYGRAVELGLFGVMLQTALLVGLFLKMRQRFALPFGSLTLIVGLNGFLLGAISDVDLMVLVAVLGGLAGDIWLSLLQDRTGVFAFAFPATLYACYFGSLQLVYRRWWEVHTVTGTIVAAGLTGWLVSILT